VGLQDRADQRVGTYSGGMKRRLNLAVALVHRPSILLLDEPTTGVDPQSRNLIFEQVRQLNADGLTVIYTSHYMEEVEALCPRIAILDHGRIVSCDLREKLLATMASHAWLEVPNLTDSTVSAALALPGVSLAQHEGNRLHIVAQELAPLLPQLVQLCGTVTRLDVQQPNLERVFLSLTGHALRD
jgi:ABC-2 type transport system ATP-binding protein